MMLLEGTPNLTESLMQQGDPALSRILFMKSCSALSLSIKSTHPAEPGCVPPWMKNPPRGFPSSSEVSVPGIGVNGQL
jgi:hypothetical protein